MDSTSHPYVIDADASGTPSDTAEMLVGTAVEFDLDPKVHVQRITRPEPGFRITEALAEALGSDMDPDEEPYVDPAEEAQALADAQAQAEPDLTGNKQTLAPDHDIHGEPTETAYQDWDYQDLKSAVKTKGIETPDLKTETLIAALVAYDKEMAEGDEDAEDSDGDDSETETE